MSTKSLACVMSEALVLGFTVGCFIFVACRRGNMQAAGSHPQQGNEEVVRSKSSEINKGEKVHRPLQNGSIQVDSISLSDSIGHWMPNILRFFAWDTNSHGHLKVGEVFPGKSHLAVNFFNSEQDTVGGQAQMFQLFERCAIFDVRNGAIIWPMKAPDTNDMSFSIHGARILEGQGKAILWLGYKQFGIDVISLVDGKEIAGLDAPDRETAIRLMDSLSNP